MKTIEVYTQGMKEAKPTESMTVNVDYKGQVDFSDHKQIHTIRQEKEFKQECKGDQREGDGEERNLLSFILIS